MKWKGFEWPQPDQGIILACLDVLRNATKYCSQDSQCSRKICQVSPEYKLSDAAEPTNSVNP
jgi:hypothetical protein